MEAGEFKRLEELLKIDKNGLDEAIIEQPEAFYEISQAYVFSVSLRDKAAEELKQIDAQVDLEIREEFEKLGKKVTEKIVDSEVRSSDDHCKAYQHYLDCKSDAEKLLALKESFIQRSYMLRELCGLYISGYGISDSSIRSDSDMKSERVDRKAKAMKDSMRN